MCGRFTIRLTWREIVALYRLSGSGNSELNRQSGGSLDKLLFPRIAAHACENGAINASTSSNSTSTSTWVETEPTFRSRLRSMRHCFV